MKIVSNVCMFDSNHFEITLFIFVIIFSGVFYLPINYFEKIYYDKKNHIIQQRILKRRKLINKKKKVVKAIKNLRATSDRLSENLSLTQIKSSSV